VVTPAFAAADPRPGTGADRSFVQHRCDSAYERVRRQVLRLEDGTRAGVVRLMRAEHDGQVTFCLSVYVSARHRSTARWASRLLLVQAPEGRGPLELGLRTPARKVLPLVLGGEMFPVGSVAVARVRVRVGTETIASELTFAG
jgi:hypothetical protein